VTERQRLIARAVRRAHPSWYRAGSSGLGHPRGEAVTLASLYRAGVLERRAWRGREGEADAAHEYRLARATCEATGLSYSQAAVATDLNGVEQH
jgi:hypothetical protein